jgi:hypothetical protein
MFPLLLSPSHQLHRSPRGHTVTTANMIVLLVHVDGFRSVWTVGLRPRLHLHREGNCLVHSYNAFHAPTHTHTHNTHTSSSVFHFSHCYRSGPSVRWLSCHRACLPWSPDCNDVIYTLKAISESVRRNGVIRPTLECSLTWTGVFRQPPLPASQPAGLQTASGKKLSKHPLKAWVITHTDRGRGGK